MVCDSCFCSHLSPCQALAKALEQNSTLTDLDLGWNGEGIRLETWEAWCFLGRGIALLRAQVRGLPKSPASKVFHTLPSKGHSNLQKHVM